MVGGRNVISDILKLIDPFDFWRIKMVGCEDDIADTEVTVFDD